MKEYHYYECETCHTEYNTEEKARDCEDIHLKPTGVVVQKSRYKSFEVFPYEVVITFDDGNTQLYEIKKDGWY